MFIDKDNNKEKAMEPFVGVPVDFFKYSNIPVYKKLWQNDTLPILEKSDITHDFPHNWLTPQTKLALERGDIEWVASSGTTSERMQIMRPANWRMEQLDKTFNQNTILKQCWDENLTRIALTTAVCSQTVCFKEDPGPAKRRIGRTLYINLSSDPQTWCKTDLERMLKEIADNAPYFFDADPLYLAFFLKSIKKQNLESYLIKPRAVTLGYELTTNNIRQYIEKTLAAPLINIYGSTELGYVLMENTQGRLTLCSELTQLELSPLDPEMGLYSLIISCTKNPYMPLIRYRSGDCIQTFHGDSANEIKRICGREKEMVKTSNGRLIPQALLDDRLSEHTPDILLYQLQEQGPDKFQLIYTTISDTPVDENTMIILQKSLSQLLTKPCTILYRQTVSPGLSGKFNWLKRAELL
jgi:phenylacetate-CoA ligase